MIKETSKLRSAVSQDSEARLDDTLRSNCPRFHAKTCYSHIHYCLCVCVFVVLNSNCDRITQRFILKHLNKSRNRFRSIRTFASLKNVSIRSVFIYFLTINQHKYYLGVKHIYKVSINHD